MTVLNKPFYIIALESFVLLTQNFVLTYPLLLFFLLIGVVMPTQHMPALEARWVVLGFGIFLIYCAMVAGSTSMAVEAVRLHLTRQQAPAPKEGEMPEIPNPFVDFGILLGEFFPGVSRYFLHFVLGLVFHILAVVAIMAWFQNAVDAAGGIPPFIEKMKTVFDQSTAAAPVSGAELMKALTPAELKQLERFSGLLLTGFLMYGAFYFLTMFWPAFVVLQNKPVWTAYWLSLKQCFTKPFQVISIAMLFIGLFFTLSLLPQLGNVAFIALWNFLNILLFVYFSLIIIMSVATSGNDVSITPASAAPVLDKNG